MRIDVARERQRLGLPLFVPEVVLGLAAMSVIRGAVGFVTFFLAFALRHLHAATWWYGFVLLTSAIGSLLGSLLVPTLRRYLSEQQLILYSLVLSALVGIVVAIVGSLWVQPLLTFAIGFATTCGQAVVRLDRAEERGPRAPRVARLRGSRPSCNWSGCSARCSP